jgi:hypothetical protein
MLRRRRRRKSAKEKSSESYRECDVEMRFLRQQRLSGQGAALGATLRHATKAAGAHTSAAPRPLGEASHSA